MQEHGDTTLEPAAVRDIRPEVFNICHTLKSHYTAQSMAVYLLKKKTLTVPTETQHADIAEILAVLENSLQKGLGLVQRLEQLSQSGETAGEGEV